MKQGQKKKRFGAQWLAAAGVAIVGLVAGPGMAQQQEPNKFLAFPCDGDIASAALGILSEHRQALEGAVAGGGGVQDVKKQLASMRKADQDIRFLVRGLMQRCAGKLDGSKMRYVMASGRTIDQVNIDALKQIIKSSGWPTISKYGEAADQSAFLVAQHADRQPQFQREVLAILEKEQAARETSGENYALLFDRVSLASGKPQRFGSQGTCDGNKWVTRPVEDAKRVDDLRRSVGLEPMAEYEAKVRAMVCGG